MILEKVNRIKFYIKLLFVFALVSCNNLDDYVQEYDSYSEFNKINSRNSGWFPVELIGQDAFDIKNVSYLSTKCVFGTFNYKDESIYDSIFRISGNIDSAHYQIFLSQIELVETIYPNWFPNLDFWDTKNTGVILFDNCYSYNDKEQKQIYYFHPPEESTLINGEHYPGVRNTIR